MVSKLISQVKVITNNYKYDCRFLAKDGQHFYLSAFNAKCLNKV